METDDVGKKRWRLDAEEATVKLACYLNFSY
jgi:hypothetical protein